MTVSRKHLTFMLSTLIPQGVAGLSACLSAADASAAVPTDQPKAAISEKLQAIRAAVSEANDIQLSGTTASKDNPGEQVAWWWRNGGWGNGGWRNGGWGNGGWHNWGNGWHNWGNGWHNW